jgi:hypothetical protein
VPVRVPLLHLVGGTGLCYASPTVWISVGGNYVQRKYAWSGLKLKTSWLRYYDGRPPSVNSTIKLKWYRRGDRTFLSCSNMREQCLGIFCNYHKKYKASTPICEGDTNYYHRSDLSGLNLACEGLLLEVSQRLQWSSPKRLGPHWVKGFTQESRVHELCPRKAKVTPSHSPGGWRPRGTLARHCVVMTIKF